METRAEVIVIGGGAAGCMAALTAARQGRKVILLEKNAKIGRKLYITGKGRCNVTNHCSVDEVLRNIPRNPKFLYSAMNRFPPDSVMSFFESCGVPLKTERGNRVFPVSDKAADIIDALLLELRKNGVRIMEDRAKEILVENSTVLGVSGERGTYKGEAVILATGGASYPRTGSTGDGYEMAGKLGHTVLPAKGSLVPLETQGDLCQRMQGLSLKNVSLKIKNEKNKVIFQDQGEMLFTHFGISGPLVLSASAHMRDYAKTSYTASIDLKPALDEQKLDARLLREFEENQNRDFQNVLATLVPKSMIPIIEELTGIPGDTKAHSIRKEQRHQLLTCLKGMTLKISGPCPVEEAIITAGGIKVSEVDPKTMGSKLVKGLYFAGEVLDVDAYTGGFNLQIAWATGVTAGENAACRIATGGKLS